MRKLKLQMQITLDSYIAGPNGEMDWTVLNWDNELNKYVTEITEPVDCILLGRILAQEFIDYWDARIADPGDQDMEGIRKMNETPKIVFSKTLKNTVWKNTTLANGDLVDEINKLKNQNGKDIIVYGGGNFVSSLIKEGLIDEFHLLVNPVAIGDGMTIFKGLADRKNFTLVKSRSFDCGIVLLHYDAKGN